jgi:hypothetical protein
MDHNMMTCTPFRNVGGAANMDKGKKIMVR